MRECWILLCVLIVCVPIIILCIYKIIQHSRTRKVKVDGLVTDDAELIKTAYNSPLYKKYWFAFFKGLIFIFIFLCTTALIIKDLCLNGQIVKIAFFLLSLVVIFIGMRSCEKIWICPHCKKRLPYKKSTWGRYTMSPELITKCPHCNCSLTGIISD